MAFLLAVGVAAGIVDIICKIIKHNNETPTYKCIVRRKKTFPDGRVTYEETVYTFNSEDEMMTFAKEGKALTGANLKSITS